jgi:predicted metal-dependent hydrolase
MMRATLAHLTPAMRLRRRVDAWAVRLRVSPRLVRIQPMTRKWGSCSSAGTITLALDLDEQSSGFQDFVIAHELLHLRVPNHSRLFKSLMTAHVPDWRALRACSPSCRVRADIGSIEEQRKECLVRVSFPPPVSLVETFFFRS